MLVPAVGEQPAYRVRPAARFQMLTRPYARPTSTQAAAFYWLVRVRESGDQALVDRGEGEPAKMRIERWLRQMAGGSSPEARLAAQALVAGWEARR